MRLSSFPQVFEEPVRDLARALGKLELEQGRQARKNARQNVRRALKRVMDRVEAEYPFIRAEPTPFGERLKKRLARPQTPQAALARFKQKMQKRDYVEALGTSLVTAILVGGVRVKHVPKLARPLSGVPFAPRWAVLAASQRKPGAGTQEYNADKVREARRSINVRKALLAAARLSGSMPTP